MDHVWMAEVGVNGLTKLCASEKEALAACADMYPGGIIQWAVWKDGVFVEGNWPKA